MFSTKAIKAKGKANEGTPLNDDEMATNNFDSWSEDDFDVICNVVKYFQWSVIVSQR